MKSEKAFTLVEVILAIGIFAILAVPIVSIFLDGIKITSKSENTSEAYAYAQQYVEKLKAGGIEVVSTTDKQLIPGTEYEYRIVVNSMKTEEQLKAEQEKDGEDFYKYMNETDSCKMILSGTSLKINTETISNFNNIEVDRNCDWIIDGATISVNKDKIWLQYGDISAKKILTINNKSGKELNIYLQWTGTDEAKKNNVVIKNIGGKINVYGPVDKSIEEIVAENRGRKKTANVTVIVENTRTGEHADLTANVVYHE